MRQSSPTVKSRDSKKGYTLDIPSLWQGCFTELKVIGDKCGADVSDTFSYDAAQAKKALIGLTINGQYSYCVHSSSS